MNRYSRMYLTYSWHDCIRMTIVNTYNSVEWFLDGTIHINLFENGFGNNAWTFKDNAKSTRSVQRSVSIITFIYAGY